ncbi:hypothetical protein BGZ76_010643 [Entomortierella beljakovae]|nr:hypothetical protein BGZ76_010643 [Entomortierella beljakovae]
MGIRTILEEARNQSGIPGMSVAILHKGKLVFAEGFGTRNGIDPFTAETLMPIASLTKAFTAAAVGELVGEGKIDWDTTPVSKYLPEFELADPTFTSQLTFQDLLSHRTGIQQVDLGWFWNTESRIDLIKRLKYVKMKPKMSPYMRYNNVMYGVAGVAAGNVEGVSYEDLVREKVFKPLGLTNTGFTTEEMSKRDNYALPYQAATFEDARNGIFEELPLDNMATACAPSGDIYSNVLDLVRWGQTIMQHGRRSADFAPVGGYGMGWGIDSYKGNIMYSHGGLNPGYRSSLTLFPDSDLVIASFSNVQTALLPGYSKNFIADEILGLHKTTDWMETNLKKTQELFDEIDSAAKGDLPERIKDKPASHAQSEIIGSYSNPVYGDVSIGLEKIGEQDAEELYFRLRVYGGKLEHYHYDSYKVIKLGYFTNLATTLVTFTAGEDGIVRSLEIELLGQMEVFYKKH